MTLIEIIRRAQADTLVDDDGQAVTLELLPGLSRTELDDGFQIIDLRRAKPGDGFTWGRCGPSTLVRRFG